MRSSSYICIVFMCASSNLLLASNASLAKASKQISKTTTHVLKIHSKLSGKVLNIPIQSETLAQHQEIAEYYKRNFIDTLATADNPLAAHIGLARFNYYSGANIAKKLAARRRARGDVAKLATGGLLSSQGVQALIEDITVFILKADEDIYHSLLNSEDFLAEFGEEELLKGLNIEAFTDMQRAKLDTQEIETLAQYYSRVPQQHRDNSLETGDAESKSINPIIAGLARIGNAEAVQDIALDGVIATLLRQELAEMGVAHAIDRVANSVVPDNDFWQVIYGAAKSGELFTDWEAMRQDSNDAMYEALPDAQALPATEIEQTEEVESAVSADLSRAVLDDDTKTVKALLENGANPNGIDSAGNKPLHIVASHGGSVQMLELLLAAGADVKAKNNAGQTPFRIATSDETGINANKYALAALLLQAAAGVNGMDEKNWTPLHWAIVSDNWYVVRKLIKQNADITAGEEHSVIDIARIMHSETKLFEVLLDKMLTRTEVSNKQELDQLLDADITAGKEQSVIDIARIMHSETKLFEVLLDKMLTRTEVSNKQELGQLLFGMWHKLGTDGRTQEMIQQAIDLWVKFDGHKDNLRKQITQLLAHSNIYTNYISNDAGVHMHVAAAAGNLQAVELLAEMGYALDAVAKESGYSNTIQPIHFAAMHGHAKVVAYMLHNSIDVNTQAGRHPFLTNLDKAAFYGATANTPLEFAAVFGHMEVMQLLLDRGAEVGDALQLAVANRHFEAVKLLLARGANIEGDGRQKTALQTILYQAKWIKSFMKESSEGGEVERYRKLHNVARENYSQHLVKITPPTEDGRNDYWGEEAFRQCLAMVELLVQHNADVNGHHTSKTYQNILNEAPIFIAVDIGYQPLVKFLVDNGANLNMRQRENINDYPKLTPAELAEQHRDARLASYLRKAMQR